MQEQEETNDSEEVSSVLGGVSDSSSVHHVHV